MKLSGISNIEKLSYNGRLSKEDIMRLPSPHTNKADFYETNKPVSVTKKHPKFWRNFFTALTFGVTGLYIAHRNNLFNPARKEAKHLVKTDAFISKIKEFVHNVIGEETFKASTHRTLKRLSENKAKSGKFIEETKRILANQSDLDALDSKVLKTLSDDKNPESLKNGYTVDVLDKLAVFLEKKFKQMKFEGKEFKGQGAEVLESLFRADEKGLVPVQEALFDIIEGRSSSTIDSFIQDSLIARIKE